MGPKITNFRCLLGWPIGSFWSDWNLCFNWYIWNSFWIDTKMPIQRSPFGIIPNSTDLTYFGYILVEIIIQILYLILEISIIHNLNIIFLEIILGSPRNPLPAKWIDMRATAPVWCCLFPYSKSIVLHSVLYACFANTYNFPLQAIKGQLQKLSCYLHPTCCISSLEHSPLLRRLCGDIEWACWGSL